MTITLRSSLSRDLTASEVDANFTDLNTNKASLASLAASSGSSLVGTIQSGTAPLSESVQDALRRFVFAAQFTGYDPTGVSDSTTAFNNARTRARAIGARLFITGTPLISSALTISAKEHWVFDGALGNYSGNYPDSYLIKKSTLNADFVTITAQGTLIEGGGLVGQVGNGGDGYVIQANSVSIINSFVTLMGQDGTRVGKATGANCNLFRLVRLICSGNVRYGINVSDNPGGSVNANVGKISSPFTQANGSHGLVVNAAWWLLITSPTSEDNIGFGAYLDQYSQRTRIVGGDIEGNTAGGLFQYNPNANEIDRLSVNGIDYSTNYATGNIAPGVGNVELLQSSTFAASGGWQLSGSTISGGALHLPANTSAYQEFKTVVGQSYTLKTTITGAVTRNIVRAGSTGASSFDLVNRGYITTTGTFEDTFVAVSTVTTVTLFNDTGSSGTSDWSLASVKGRIASAGGISSSHATQGIGYATGSGGTVTQGAGSGKSTGVTLDKATGEITMNNANLAADTTVSFTLTSAAIAAGDHVLVQHVSAGTVGSYTTTAVAAGGSATVYVHNVTTGGLAEAIVLKYSVLKAVTA